MSLSVSKTKILSLAKKILYCLMLAYLSTSIWSYPHPWLSHTDHLPLLIKAKLFPLLGTRPYSCPQLHLCGPRLGSPSFSRVISLCCIASHPTYLVCRAPSGTTANTTANTHRGRDTSALPLIIYTICVQLSAWHILRSQTFVRKMFHCSLRLTSPRKYISVKIYFGRFHNDLHSLNTSGRSQ